MKFEQSRPGETDDLKHFVAEGGQRIKGQVDGPRETRVRTLTAHRFQILGLNSHQRMPILEIVDSGLATNSSLEPSEGRAYTEDEARCELDRAYSVAAGGAGRVLGLGCRHRGYCTASELSLLAVRENSTSNREQFRSRGGSKQAGERCLGVSVLAMFWWRNVA